MVSLRTIDVGVVVLRKLRMTTPIPIPIPSPSPSPSPILFLMNIRTTQYLSITLFTLLLLGGFYSLLVYLGVPYHGAAMLPDETISAISASCGDTAYFCKGIATIKPFVLHTFVRAAPFLWYAILWFVAWAAFCGWRWMATNRKVVRIVWAPWKIFLLFVVSVWLFSTITSFGTVDDRSQRIYPEPTQGTYSVSEHALQTLQNDYQTMLAQGCLDSLGQSQTGAGIYMMSGWCIEKAFVTRVLAQVLFVFLLLAEFLILGRMALGWIRYRAPNDLLELVFSAGVGASMGIALLWTLAVAGIYVAASGWVLALAIPVVAYPHTLYWAKKFCTATWEREYRWWDISLLLGFLLMSYLALNFLQVVRPFPIGWDDLGSYLNRPRLLVSYGRFISTMSPFDWSYLTSLGFLLFGYGSPAGATASMMVNWSSGVLAVFGVFAFARTFLGHRSGFLSALIYYTLPLVGHFSYADMKIDNAIFFFGVLATLALLLAMLPETDENADANVGAVREPPLRHAMPLLILTGIFLGIAFATKVTSIMVILPLFALFVGAMFDWRAFLGMFLLTCELYLWQGVASVDQIATRILGGTPPAWMDISVSGALIGAGIGCIAWSYWRKRPALLPMAMLFGALALGLALAVLPWAEHTAIEQGRIMPQPRGSVPNKISPVIDTDTMPGDLAVDKTNPACKATGALEELDRYWGFGQGWSHYLTLPWRTVMNLDATGYYVTTVPALLLFPLLLLLPYFWTRKGRWLRWLFGATVMMLMEWIFLGNGIPWYGIGIFLGLAVGLEALLQHAPDRPNKIVMGTLLAFSLLIAFNMRFWQFEQQRNILEYSMGKVSADALREITIPYYDGISATAVDRHSTMPDRPYLYRIGTFIPYFIPQNLEIIAINDHQLDMFNCLYQERDPELTIRRLKYLKFNSIVFDTNTSTIEKDENGSLHKKVNAFVEFVNNPLSHLQVAISDTGAGLAFILIP
ncbi:hypothetical protein EXS70_03715 [Candidatus Peribacteria bacterium]|nr:hypothetical protein [Candidatus Peribacteria bacterium]